MANNQPNTVFFIGIGGIGMSALARYYLANGVKVLGYDKTQSNLTDALVQEGAKICFHDEWDEEYPYAIESTLVVYTPAIPGDNNWLNGFRSRGYRVLKRSEVLGEITRVSKALCVAGTHGKSTTSAMLAYLLKDSPIGCNAFLGAIATNFGNNFLIDNSSEYAVIEADEYDRSFLTLSPFAAIITNIDPDHLDIYSNEEKFKEGFRQFAMKINPAGVLLIKEGMKVNSLCKTYSYGINVVNADYNGWNLRETVNGACFDLKTPNGIYSNITIGINGSHNVENAIAALGICDFIGLDLNELATKFSGFKGLKRRFEFVYASDEVVYIDDYAHHPTEINRLINSVRIMFPNKKITGVFQPHLFSRTRDFGEGFAEELAKLDDVFLLPIYPAREEPIQGIDSVWLLQKIKNPNKWLLNKTNLLDRLRDINGVLLTIGAGDIDRFVLPIKEMLAINDNTI